MAYKKAKRFGALILAASVMVASMQMFPVTAAAAAAENLALKSGTAFAESSVEAGTDFSAGKAFDGNTSTRWAGAANGEPQWIQISWDAVQEIKGFKILWERRNATSYSIKYTSEETVTEATQWTTAKSFSTNPRLREERINLDAAVQAKHVRLCIDSYTTTEPGGSLVWNAISVNEFGIYAEDAPDERSEAQKVVEDKLAAPAIEDGSLVCQWISEEDEEASVEFVSAYEQVIENDGTIHTPISDKNVPVNYKVTKDGDTVTSNAYMVEVPGKTEPVSGANEKPEVIPELQEWSGKTGDFLISATSRIIVDSGDYDALADVAAVFAENYKDVTGMEISVKKGGRNHARTGDFYMTLNPKKQTLGEEGYCLDIADATVIEAFEPVGAHWGAISVLQILKQTKGVLPKGEARDYPKFEVRAFSLDVGRKPFTIDTLYTFMRNMSWYKMNSFQVHLSDNLIFMEDYPTQQDAINEAYGGMRLESGVISEDGNTATAEDVYYTKQEFKEFIQDSRVMGVDIVPEFDMPAHAWPFMKAFPEHRSTAQVNNGSRYRIDELDLSDPETTEWAKEIWNDYFTGEDPVFDEDVTIHIGTDEYHGEAGVKGENDFRRFSNDMIEFIQGTGRTVRMWGSLSNKRGGDNPEPVKAEDVQLNIWNTGYADPTDMYNLGFDLINTLEGPNYLVPGAGYYNDYINAESIYNSWKPNAIGNLNAAEGDDQILGGCYATWHDSVDTRANGISEYDSFDRFFSTKTDRAATIAAYSSKLWGETAGRTYNELTEVAAETGTAPNADMYADVDTASEKIAEYTFDGDDMKTDSSANSYDLSGEAADTKRAEVVAGENGETKALKLDGGESYVTTPLNKVRAGSMLAMRVKMDAGAEGEQILCESKDEFGAYGTYAFKAVQKTTGKVGFSREGYDYSFNYTLPEDQWVTLLFESGQNNVQLYVDEGNGLQLVDNKHYVKDGNGNPTSELETVNTVNGNTVIVSADNNPDIYFENHPEIELSANLKRFGIHKIATMLVPIGRIGSATKSFKGQIESVTVSKSIDVSLENDSSVADSEIIATASSYTNDTDNPPAFVLDDTSLHFWHTNTSQGKDADAMKTDPHWIKLSFRDGSAKTIQKLTYLPRQNSVNDRIAEYGIEAELADGTTKEVAHGTWSVSDNSLKTVTFEAVEAKSITLKAYASQGRHATAERLKLYGVVTAEQAEKDLSDELARYTSYNEADYTDVSWLAFDGAREMAQKVLDYEGHSYEECYRALEKLQEAAEGLQLKPSLNKYADQLKEYENKDTSPYFFSDVEAYEKAVNDAFSLLDGEEFSEDALRGAIEKITAAYDALEEKTVEDADAVAAVRDAQEKLEQAIYSEESANQMQAEIDRALNVLRDKKSTQSQIDEILQRLGQIKLEAHPVVAGIEDAQTKLEEAKETYLYTKASIAAFEKAISDARKIVGNEDSERGDYDKAWQDILNNGLKLHPGIEQLDAKEALVNGNTQAYTADSVSKLKEEIDRTKTMLMDQDATDEQIAQQLAKLGSMNLVLKSAGGSGAALPANGDTIVSADGTLSFRVTKSDAKNGTVSVSALLKKSQKKIVIPAEVKKDGYTFKVTSIDAKVFRKSKITSVEIGSNVESIGKNAFTNSKKLKLIIFKGTNAPTIAKKSMKGIAKKCTVTVPKKMKSKQLKSLKSRMKKAGVKNVTYKKAKK